MNRERKALIDILNIVKECKVTLTEKETVSEISDYLENILELMVPKKSWNLSCNDSFKKDIRSGMKVSIISEKYNTTPQNIYYHKRIIKNETKSTL